MPAAGACPLGKRVAVLESSAGGSAGSSSAGVNIGPTCSRSRAELANPRHSSSRHMVGRENNLAIVEFGSC